MYARHVFAWYRRSEGSTGSWELSYPKPLEVLCKCSLWFCFVLVTASHYVGLAILELTEIHPPLPLCLSLCLLSTGVKVVKHINALNGGGSFLLPQVLYVEQFGLEFVLLLLPLYSAGVTGMHQDHGLCVLQTQRLQT